MKRKRRVGFDTSILSEIFFECILLILAIGAYEALKVVVVKGY